MTTERRLIERLAAELPPAVGTHYSVRLRREDTDETLVMGWDDTGSSSVRHRGDKMASVDMAVGGDTEAWVAGRVADLLVQGWRLAGLSASAPRTVPMPDGHDDDDEPPPGGLY